MIDLIDCYCPHASRVASDGGRLLAAELQLPFLGVVPIDVELAACEDAGLNFFAQQPQSNTLDALASFADRCCADAAAHDDPSPPPTATRPPPQ